MCYVSSCFYNNFPFFSALALLPPLPLSTALPPSMDERNSFCRCKPDCRLLLTKRHPRFNGPVGLLIPSSMPCTRVAFNRRCGKCRNTHFGSVATFICARRCTHAAFKRCAREDQGFPRCPARGAHARMLSAEVIRSSPLRFRQGVSKKTGRDCRKAAISERHSCRTTLGPDYAQRQPPEGLSEA